MIALLSMLAAMLDPTAQAGLDTRDIAQVLAACAKAEAAGDANGMLAAACALTFADARAPDDTPDLSKVWAGKAKSMGAVATPDNCPQWRGRTRGPAYRRAVVRAHATYTTDQVFTGGERAEISLEATNGGDLTLGVSDRGGGVICAASRNQCAWTPAWTQSFTISIQSYDDRDQAFYLISN